MVFLERLRLSTFCLALSRQRDSPCLAANSVKFITAPLTRSLATIITLLLRELKLPVAHPRLTSCRFKMLDSAGILVERAVISVKLWTCALEFLFRISPRSSAILSFSVVIVSASSRKCFLPTPFLFIAYPTIR